MKNGITKISNLDDGKMSAAIKKAVLNFKATTGQAGTTGAITTTKQTASKNQATINPSKIENVEKRLNAADQAIILPVKRPTVPGNTVRKTPKLSEVQQYEDYYRQEQQRNQAIDQAKAQELFERALRHDLFGEPLAKKPTPLESGVIALKDSGSASLGAGSPLAKNGARTRGYTDTASDSGAPIRFTGGTLKDIERKHNEAMARKDDTLDRLYATLDVHHIDRSKLSPEQEEIVGLVEQELIKKSVLGTLTERERESVIDRTWKFLYTNTKSVNGDPYPVFIDIAKTGGNTPYDAIIDVAHEYDYSSSNFPEQLAMNTNILSDEELKSIFEYGRQKSNNDIETEKYKQQFAYKNKVYVEEMNNYYDDLRKGKATPEDRKKYLDQALLRIYEDCFKPVPVKDKRGNDAGTIPIGDLILPYDDSLGARVARYALEKIGTEYKYMDCEGLIKWSYSQIDPMLGEYGIGGGAYYQRLRTSKGRFWKKTEINPEIPIKQLESGDLLYWENEEGETVHTAMYLGNGYMIESAGPVEVTLLREYTSYGDGHGSQLTQINRPTEELLYENAEKNSKKH